MGSPTHVPFSDVPERKSPLAAIAPWLVAAVAIAVGAYLFLRIPEDPPVADVKITKLFAVQQPGVDRVIVGIEVRVKNIYTKDIIVRGINVKLVTADQQNYTDQPAGAGENARYFAAIPELKQSDAPQLPFDTKLSAGQEATGLLMVSFPVTKDVFDKRQSLEVKIDFYGMKPVTAKP
jgi:hypothetical protein